MRKTKGQSGDKAALPFMDIREASVSLLGPDGRSEWGELKYVMRLYIATKDFVPTQMDKR